MKAVVLAGGDIKATPQLQSLVQGADLVIAADGGLRHAAPLELTPTLIVGDFDSVSDKDLSKYSNVPKEQHPEDKNELDLELALHHALAKRATKILLVGTLGGRFDQSLAAVFIAAKHASKAQLSLHSGSEDLYLLSQPEMLTLEAKPGQRFSLLSVCQPSAISVKGAHYNLEEKTLDFGVGLGISNEVLESNLVITVHSGLVALILEHHERPL